MTNSVTLQTILDGPRNTVIKIEGVLDTSDLALMTLADPALLAGIDNTGTLKAKTLRINKIIHNVEDGLSVNLFWDATTPARCEELTGRGQPCYEEFGGLITNAGVGATGKILVSTQGWAAAGVLSFSVIVELVKAQ